MKNIIVPAALLEAYEESVKTLEELVEAYEKSVKKYERQIENLKEHSTLLKAEIQDITESRNIWRTQCLIICKKLKKAEAEKEEWRKLYLLSAH